MGAVRSEALLAVPRHAVFAVETRSWKSFVSPSQGAVAPVVGPGALMKCRTAIGQRVAVGGHPGATDHLP